jgi:large subunit ribosomal protein L15
MKDTEKKTTKATRKPAEKTAKSTKTTKAEKVESAPVLESTSATPSRMTLNSMQPAPGSKRKFKRLGRGIGSGKGKTCGRGHKGQRARAGGYHKVGFEGGQMPIQRRIPKSGFTSRQSLTRQEVYLSDLGRIEGDTIDMTSLRASGLIKFNTKEVKIVGSQEITRAFIVRGISVTAGARKAIEAAKGKVEA